MRVKMAIMLAALLGLAGCGPLNGTPNSNPDHGPANGAVAPGDWITFVGVALDAAGVETDTEETGSISVGAFNDNMQPVTVWIDAQTGQPTNVMHRPAIFPYPFAVQVKADVYIYSFTAQAILPPDWYMYCEVLRGNVSTDILGPALPVISANKSEKATGSAIPTPVSCTYPEIGTLPS